MKARKNILQILEHQHYMKIAGDKELKFKINKRQSTTNHHLPGVTYAPSLQNKAKKLKWETSWTDAKMH